MDLPLSNDPTSFGIDLENVGVRHRSLEILREVTCSIPAGRTTAIIGPNGAGKTTLLLAILGLVSYSGEIRFRGPAGMVPAIGYVPQRLDFDRGLPCTVEDLMALSYGRKPLWSGGKRKREEQIKTRLARVGAQNLSRRFLGKLSGGEMQRVLLAMALEGNPNILFLDEPTAGIDAPGEQLFCDLLSDIQKRAHLTVVMVSHDLSVVTNHADYVICLNRTVRCCGGLSTLTEENLLKTFGLHLQLYPHSHGPHSLSGASPR
jgi:zinc transport system ATP-binding protein